MALVDRTAARLHEAGVAPRRPGRRARRVGRRRSCTSSILGILAAGAAYVPVDADDPDERARLVFGEAPVRGHHRRRRRVRCADAPSRRGRCAGRVRCFDGAPPHPSTRAITVVPPPTARRRRVDHLHVGLDRRAEGRRGEPPLGRGVRGCRSAAVPAGCAARPRRPRARGPVGRVRRLVRGDVARLAPRRVPRAGAAVARALRRGPRAVARAAGDHGRLDGADARGDVARRTRSRTSGC